VKAQKKQAKTRSIETTTEHATGAIYAFAASMLGEFSQDGGTGVVEVRFKQGQPLGVVVRKLRTGEDVMPKCERGEIAGWELSTADLVAVFSEARARTAY
jgi:hypothetical protein